MTTVGKRIGIIGTGKQGRRYLQTISKMPGVEVVGVSNRHGNHGDYKCFLDWKDLFSFKLDGLILAADPLINYQVMQMANFTETPVMVEKPVGLYLTDVEKMNKFRMPILVDYIHLANPAYIDMKKDFKSPIRELAFINYNFGPFRHYSSLYDYLPHDLSMLFDLCPDQDFKIVDKSVKGGRGGMLYRIELASDKVKAHILVGNGGEKKARKLAVFCNQQQLVYDDTFAPQGEVPLRRMLEHFLEVIDGKPVKIPFAMTLKIHQLLYQLGKNEVE